MKSPLSIVIDGVDFTSNLALQDVILQVLEAQGKHQYVTIEAKFRDGNLYDLKRAESLKITTKNG